MNGVNQVVEVMKEYGDCRGELHVLFLCGQGKCMLEETEKAMTTGQSREHTAKFAKQLLPFFKGEVFAATGRGQPARGRVCERGGLATDRTTQYCLSVVE